MQQNFWICCGLFVYSLYSIVIKPSSVVVVQQIHGESTEWNLTFNAFCVRVYAKQQSRETRAIRRCRRRLESTVVADCPRRTLVVRLV